MAVRPDCAAIVFLVLHVVDDTKYWLEEKQDEHDDADNGMIVVQQVVRDVVDHPNTKAERDNVRDVCEELEDAVDEPDTAEGAQADKDGASWEEENKGEGCENAVGYQHLLSRIDEGL